MIMKRAEQRDQCPATVPISVLDQVAQRAAVAARRDEQDDEVLHRAGEHHAGQDPQRARQVAHLRGEHRADQRAGAGDGREVVAEQHVLVGGHVVEAVVVAHAPASCASASSRSTRSAMNRL